MLIPAWGIVIWLYFRYVNLNSLRITTGGMLTIMINSLLDELETSTLADPLAFIQDKMLKTQLEKTLEGLHLSHESSYSQFHHLLASLNRKRLSIDLKMTSETEAALNFLCGYLEEHWLQHERARIAPKMKEVPVEQAAFIDWFESLQQNGYGQGHPLFLYLSERASREEFHYFLKQETSTEAGFDDLIALTQVKTPPFVKMELAHNFWDEMGEGELEGVHSHQLTRLIESFHLSWQTHYEDVHWEPLALSNMMIAVATKRSRFYQSIGALGAIELTAPGRCQKVMEGLKRIGLSSTEYHYYTLHSVLDVSHWEGWKENVLTPLLAENPESILPIAEGALLRLFAGERCYRVYSQHLGFYYRETMLPCYSTVRPLRRAGRNS